MVSPLPWRTLRVSLLLPSAHITDCLEYWGLDNSCLHDCLISQPGSLCSVGAVLFRQIGPMSFPLADAMAHSDILMSHSPQILALQGPDPASPCWQISFILEDSDQWPFTMSPSHFSTLLLHLLWFNIHPCLGLWYLSQSVLPS